jgi:hypothetical protein
MEGPVSKKERGPKIADYHVVGSVALGYQVHGPDGYCQGYPYLYMAIRCAQAQNIAYLAGKRSRSKGRGK